MTETEWRAIDELRRCWHDFCDADPVSPDFAERMEAQGLIQLRSVTKADVRDDPFAAERGIELGGSIWVLTEAGRAALREQKDASHG